MDDNERQIRQEQFKTLAAKQKRPLSSRLGRREAAVERHKMAREQTHTDKRRDDAAASGTSRGRGRGRGRGGRGHGRGGHSRGGRGGRGGRSGRGNSQHAKGGREGSIASNQQPHGGGSKAERGQVSVASDSGMLLQPLRERKGVLKQENAQAVKKREKETDPHRIAQRQKQIDFGKNTIGYDNYITFVPKTDRRKHHPKTPDIHVKCSKRQWSGRVQAWRRALHLWDEVTDETSASNLSASLAKSKDVDSTPAQSEEAAQPLEKSVDTAATMAEEEDEELTSDLAAMADVDIEAELRAELEAELERDLKAMEAERKDAQTGYADATDIYTDYDIDMELEGDTFATTEY